MLFPMLDIVCNLVFCVLTIELSTIAKQNRFDPCREKKIPKIISETEGETKYDKKKLSQVNKSTH